MTRGDTLRFKLELTGYTPATGDEIKFGVKESYDDTTCLIEKTIPLNTMELHLTPSDTEDLDFGTYVWDCQITFANGDVYTFITKAKLKIKEEVV